MPVRPPPSSPVLPSSPLPASSCSVFFRRGMGINLTLEVGMRSAEVVDAVRTQVAPVRERVYKRVYEVLTGKDNNSKFATLSAADRQSILEIVRDTKPNLPQYWNP